MWRCRREVEGFYECFTGVVPGFQGIMEVQAEQGTTHNERTKIEVSGFWSPKSARD